VELVVAVADEQQDRAVGQAAHEHAEQVEGRRIGPLEVVEDDEQRPLRRGPLQADGERLGDPMALEIGVAGRLGSGRVQLGRKATQDGVVERAGQVAQCLGDRCVGQRTLLLEAGAPQHVDAGRPLARLLEQSRLAHAGLAGDEHELAAPGGRCPRERRDRVELAGAAHERRAGQLDAKRLHCAHVAIIAGSRCGLNHRWRG
jgi:hypothetical protein